MNKKEMLQIGLIKQSKSCNAPELVRIGLPFPEGDLPDVLQLELCDHEGQRIPASFTTTACWNDGSVKWAVLEFFMDVAESSATNVKICLNPDAHMAVPSKAEIEESSSEIRVHRNGVNISVAKDSFRPFNSVSLHGDVQVCKSSLTEMTLMNGEKAAFTVEKVSWRDSEIVTRITMSGGVGNRAAGNLAEFSSTILIYDELVKVELSLRNPKSAKHYGGIWDLGDSNSLYIKDFSQKMDMAPLSSAAYSMGNKLNHYPSFSIYQGSSGGDNSRHPNHMNRNGGININCDGFSICGPEGELEKGKRLNAEIVAQGEGFSVAVAMENFWQNFPKKMAIEDGSLKLGFFPAENEVEYELQPGEQKTHSYYLRFMQEGARLAWLYEPIRVEVPHAWYLDSKAVPYLAAADKMLDPVLENMITSLVEGENTLLDRREVIDEYGWRNFGDIFADHEYYECAIKPDLASFTSHYNNQYDLLSSMLFQYLKTGYQVWLTISKELAEHLVDIDIYHTDRDKSAFNNGMFWHTEHFASAHTATHRSFSVVSKKSKGLRSYGGGPAYDHDYARGLKLYYFLTGDVKARQAVLDLADWTIRGIDGITTFVETFEHLIKQRMRRRYAALMPYGFNGPGRPGGNALNVMLDAFELTNEISYLRKAEELIRKCISPGDDIDARNLLEPNIRWMYTIFLMALESYLHIKRQIKEFDEMYAYGAVCMRNYALWMSVNEVSLFERVGELDYPNYATRAAQDLRKSCVMLAARKYCDEEQRAAIYDRACTIYDKSVKFLSTTENRFLIRPIAVVMAVEGSLKNGINTNDSEKCALATGSHFEAVVGNQLPKVSSILRYTSLVKEFRAIKRRVEELIFNFSKSWGNKSVS